MIHVPKNYYKLYSTSHQSIQTLNIIKSYCSKTSTITDATAGIGGNSIYFSLFFNKVICIELDKEAYLILKKNLKNYSNIEFYNNDYVSISNLIRQDIIFLDPPWEDNYKTKSASELYLTDTKIETIIENLYNSAKIIALKCPLNFDKQINLWNCTTHYIYGGKKAVYKLLMFTKNN